MSQPTPPSQQQMQQHQLMLNSKSFYLQAQQYLEQLRKEAAAESSLSLLPYGQKVYSQNDEDGILAEIFQRIGTTNKTFVELGVSNGLECNTLALLFSDWQGLWIDGNEQAYQQALSGFKNTLEAKHLTYTHAFITKDNIDELISSKIKASEIDLLSIDLDGNDFHIWQAIQCISPRVLVMEYNAKFAPPINYCMPYNPSHLWDGSDNFGVSLNYLNENIQGYRLVACNLVGCNAFFVRKDIDASLFHKPSDANAHYQPARHFLGSLPSGQQPSYDTLENFLLSK